MLNLSGKRVYLACGHTDMRKSINGLSAIVGGSFQLDPFDGALFVFCNRKRELIEIRNRHDSQSGIRGVEGTGRLADGAVEVGKASPIRGVQ